MSNFTLGTSESFKLELEELLNEYDFDFKNSNLVDSSTYKITLKGKDKKKVTDEFLLDLTKHGFDFFNGSNWLIIW